MEDLSYSSGLNNTEDETMAKVEIYTKDYCPYCMRAKHLLETKGVKFEEYDITNDAAGQRDMIQRSERRTVPQIFIDGFHVGGSDDLIEANRSGQLDQLLAGKSAA